jgi:hypothetical protein
VACPPLCLAASAVGCCGCMTRVRRGPGWLRLGYGDGVCGNFVLGHDGGASGSDAAAGSISFDEQAQPGPTLRSVGGALVLRVCEAPGAGAALLAAHQRPYPSPPTALASCPARRSPAARHRRRARRRLYKVCWYVCFEHARRVQARLGGPPEALLLTASGQWLGPHLQVTLVSNW